MVPEGKAKNSGGRKGGANLIVGMLGYGSQGRALALNLRDSGYGVLVGLRARSKSRRRAAEDGIKSIVTPVEMVRRSDLVCFAFPDHLHGRVYHSTIERNLRPGATLLFLHGMSIHFGLVRPPQDSDVILIAPHAPGIAVREKYLGDRTVSAFYAVAQNRSGKAPRRLFALASAMGFERRRLLKGTFEDEAIGDIFGEQAVLCGGLAGLIKSGFEVLVENGLKPENAYLEVAYQLDLIVDLIKKYGIEGMFKRISVTARFGSAESGTRVIGPQVKRRMETAYKDIKSGRFSARLADLSGSDLRKLNERLKALSHPDLEKAARKFSR
jgi:ketol-acid reductoisomerase